jgi:hypothetical protein
MGSARLMSRLLLAVGLTVPGALLPEAAASAAQSNCGVRTSYFDGYVWDNRWAPRFEGADATLTLRTGGLCGTDQNQISNFTNAWSMIAGDPSGSACGWAQSGFERGYVVGGGNNIRHFGQISNDTCSILDTRYSSSYITPGTTHDYYSGYVPQCACAISYVDGVPYRTSSFDPYGTWTYPFQPQFNGETSYLQNDMPGSSTSHTQFRSLMAENASTDIYVQMPCGMIYGNSQIDYGYSPVTWQQSSSNCQSFDIWTQ